MLYYILLTAAVGVYEGFHLGLKVVIDNVSARVRRVLTIINYCLVGFFGLLMLIYGTQLAEGKEVREIDGTWYVLETPLKADFAIVKAWKGDRHGNLVFRHTANNFNQVMATAAEVTIAEVEELVEPGELDPNEVQTPGIYVDRIIAGPHYDKPIEFKTVRSPS